MSIEYEFTFSYSDQKELSNYIMSMPYFEKYDQESYSYIFRKAGNKYPDTVIRIHEIGIIFNDYLTGIGRELIGLLVEHITGNYGKVIIDEID